MPYQTVSGQEYALISFDKDGHERTGDPAGNGGLFSDVLLERAGAEPITDIFFFSHGWKGDVPRALEQYDEWVGAQAALTADVAAMTQRRPNFRPLRIGLHWPSQPWGDEDLGGIDFAPGGGVSAEALVQRYVEVLGDAPGIRADLETIVTAARDNAAATELPPEVREAYLHLDAALDLGADGPGAPPDADREPFDPDVAFNMGEAEAADFGGGFFGGILGPLRQLSFWTMKKRARSVGEGDMHRFLAALQERTAALPARVHLMGHSFGCIVVSAMIGGKDGAQTLPRPVDSVVLVQGALSLWSYCLKIPHLDDTPGYFHRLIAEGKIGGPVVTTRSRYDAAVGRFYPLAAQVGPQDFGEDLPKYGGIGAWGIQGLASGVEDRPMLPATENYGFAPKTVYNLESSEFIRDGDGPSGAHSDIAGPEVAHAIWQAALP
jgi:hypothetical protein